MKNKAAQALGKLSAQKRDTSSEAMRALVMKRWDNEKNRKDVHSGEQKEQEPSRGSIE
jgi:hypothetical protein